MFPPHRRHYLAAFTADVAVASAFHVAPFFIFDHLGGGAGMSGLIGGLQAGCYAAILLLSARFVSRMRDGMGIAVFGAGGFLLFWLAAPWVKSPWVFGACTVIGITTMALFWAAMQSYLGNEPDPKVRGRRIAWYNISWCLGLAVGPLMAAPLYNQHYLLPFALIAVATAITIALVISLPRQPAAVPIDEADAGAVADARASRVHLYYAWAANATGSLLIGVMRTVFPKRVEELAGADALAWFLESPGHIGIAAVTLFAWISMVLYLVRTVISLAMGSSQFWQYRFWFLAALQMAGAAAFFGLGTTQSITVMFACCCVVGTTGAATFFASLSYSIADPARKHGNASIHESMVGVGALVGSLSFGWLAERYYTAWPFLYTPWLIAALIAFQYALFVQARHRDRLAG